MDSRTAWNAYYGQNEDNYGDLLGPTMPYKELAQIYDKLTDAMGFNAPSITARTLLEQYKNQETKQLRVLDIGCGTGLVGECLRKYNFKGSIYGIDGSQEMLEVAKSKNVYNNAWCKMISQNHPVAVEPTDLYDAIIMSASLGPEHVEAELIFDLMKITKPKGYVIVSNRTTGDPIERIHTIEHPLKKVVELGIAELISKTEFNYYENGFDGQGNCIPFLGDCFCFQKL